VPEPLGQWFPGSVEDTLYRVLPNDAELLGVRWRSFAAEHPDARPPAGYEWLDDPSDPRQSTAEQIREARKLLQRSR
jgi:hypothetical protein